MAVFDISYLMEDKKHIYIAVGYGFIAAIMYAIIGALGKYAMEGTSASVVLFFRFFVGFILILPFLKGEPDLFKIVRPWLMILRGFISFSIFGCILYALQHIPIANVIILSTSYPLFLPIISKYIFKRHISVYMMIGIGIGFVGLIFSLNPSVYGFAHLPALFALLGGILTSISFILVRQLNKTATSAKIIFDFYVIAVILSTILAIIYWKTPPLKTFVALIAMGFVGNFYQSAFNYALKQASTVVVAPVMFISILFGIMLDWMIWHEKPQQSLLIGSLFILASLLLTLYMSHKHAQHLK
ncbi:MAG: DMT family transporter [Chlamydiales bacterium]|nr:DMT family transporter [Chlamydiales bacterium]